MIISSRHATKLQTGTSVALAACGVWALAEQVHASVLLEWDTLCGPLSGKQYWRSGMNRKPC